MNSRYTVLCVDDEEENLRSLERILRREFNILSASSARAALDRLAQSDVQLIISDQRMPEMTGVEFFERVIETHPQAIRILLTGYTDAHTMIDAINNGRIYKYITKPWDPTELLITVRQGLEHHQLSKENSQLVEKLKSLLFQAESAARREALINQISNAIRRSLALDEILEATSRELLSAMDASRVIVRRRVGNQLVVAREHHQPDVTSPRDIPIYIDDPVLAKMLATRDIVAVDDMASYGVPPQAGVRLMELIKLFEAKSLLACPIFIEDRFWGALVVHQCDRRRLWTENDKGLTRTIAGQLAIAIRQAELFDQVCRAKREWETTFDAMSDGVIIFDAQGRIKQVNAVAARMMGMLVGDLIGRVGSELLAGSGPPVKCLHIEPLEGEHQNNQRQPKEEFERYFALALTGQEQSFELRFVGESLSQSDLVATLTPWREADEVIGVIGHLRDVTEQKRLREQLMQSEKMAATGQLISGVAHELNNPLTSILCYSQMAQEGIGGAEMIAEYLRRVASEADRARRIVRNLLTFARQQKPQRCLTDINDLIERTVELRAYENRVNNIEVRKFLDPHLPEILCDPQQIQQVFLNIIINAEQAMLEARNRGKLIIFTASTASTVSIRFVDDGPGIPPENQRRIFDPFFTTKEVGKGTGLGLSICYGIVKEHGGNIYVESREGGGARFVVELPIVGREQPASQTVEETLPEARFAPGKEILVIDDETLILDLIDKVLSRIGHKVDTLKDGSAAIDKIKQKKFDLIICDMKMPGISGAEVYHQIKSVDPNLVERILFITGDTINPETADFLTTSGCPFLLKPFTESELRSAISKVFDTVAC